VVVVVGPPAQVAPQASQQLGQALTVPPFAVHASALRRTRQRVRPLRVVQHVTAPGRPQVELFAQRRTTPAHPGGSSAEATSASTAALTQRR
jgi:hypothetical protein